MCVKNQVLIKANTQPVAPGFRQSSLICLLYFCRWETVLMPPLPPSLRWPLQPEGPPSNPLWNEKVPVCMLPQDFLQDLPVSQAPRNRLSAVLTACFATVPLNQRGYFWYISDWLLLHVNRMTKALISLIHFSICHHDLLLSIFSFSFFFTFYYPKHTVKKKLYTWTFNNHQTKGVLAKASDILLVTVLLKILHVALFLVYLSYFFRFF